MATRQRGWPAKNVSTCSRLSFLRNTTAPDTLAPCAWNTCLARSRPMVLTSSTDASLRWSSNTTTLARRCRRGASTPSLEDDDVPRRLAARPGRGAMAPRRAHQRRDVPALCRHGPRPDPAGRRHRRHGQSRLAQEQGRAARHQGGRRPPAFPAQILARPEPHRAALLKAQALAPTGRRPNRRCRLQCPRPDPRDRHPTRMLKLLHSRRVRTNVNSSRSRAYSVLDLTTDPIALTPQRTTRKNHPVSQGHRDPSLPPFNNPTPSPRYSFDHLITAGEE